MLSWQLMTKDTIGYFDSHDYFQELLKEYVNRPILSKIWKKEYGMEIDE